MKILNYIGYGILVGAVIVLAILFGIEKKNHNKTKSELYACIHAPTKTDTVIITKEVQIKVYSKPIYISGKPIPQTGDTTCNSVKTAYFTENLYSDTLKTKDFDLTVNAKVSKNTLTELSYSKYKLHTIQLITTKTVDTCFDKKPAYYPKNHIGLDIDLIGNSISKMPNFGAGLWWTIMDKFGLSAGGEYSMYHNEIYAKIGVKLFLK